MTEPVAYWHIPQIENEEIFVSFNPSKTSNFEDIPLYTAEDLHPRVKMTKSEFDEWKDLYNRSVMFSEAIEITDLDYSHNYDNISKKIWVGNRENNIENEAIFAKLYADFDSDNPDETIEIVPNMKWFVAAKEPSFNGKYSAIKILDIEDVHGIYSMYDYDKIPSYAHPFDTKEEAELWENPLTEAVQLPVEEN